VVEKEVVKEVEVEVIVEKEVVKEVKVPGETVVVEKEVIKEVEVAAPAEKVLRYRVPIQEVKWVPHSAVNEIVSLIGNHTFSSLLQPDPIRRRFVPELAERWELNDDGTEATFYLRKNAFFHDGTQVTAKDVRWTYMSRLHSETPNFGTGSLPSLLKGAQAYYDGEATDIPGIVVVDDYTIKFIQEFPTGDLLSGSGFDILPEHILGSVNPADIDDHEFFKTSMVGSGPYKFVQHKVDQFVEFQADPNYFLGKPRIDKVLMITMSSNDAAQIALTRGEIDTTLAGDGLLSEEGMQAMLLDDRFDVYGIAGTNASGYSFYVPNPLINDVRIRQAWFHALDRKGLMKSFAKGGLGMVHNTIMWQPEHNTPEMMADYEYNPEKAKQLLAAAGWDSSVTVPIATPDFMVANTAGSAQLAAEKQMLEAVGIKIEFVIDETAAWVKKYYQTEPPDYIVARVGGWGPTVSYAKTQWHSAGGGSCANGICNDEFDALIDRVPKALSKAEKDSIGLEINKILHAQIPVVTFWTGSAMFPVSKNVRIPGFGVPQRPQATTFDTMELTPRFCYNCWWFYRLEAYDVVNES
jgi:peptide/nickel transport system substrate-binding protein